MNELEVNTRIQTLAAQRNALADQIVVIAGQSAVQMQQLQDANDALKRRIEELEAQVKELKPQEN